MKLPSLLLVIVFVSVSSSAIPPGSTIDIKHYVFTIELNDSTDVIYGDAIVHLSVVKATSEIELDLMEKMSAGKGMAVSALYVDERKVAFVHRNGKLVATLEQPVAAGSNLRLQIHYSGIPADGLIIGKNKYGDRTFFGDNWPNRARHWLPVVDHPADKATVEFKVIAPPFYEAIANGLKVEESFLDKRRKLTHWREDVALPTKVMVIGVARFAIQYAGKINDIPVEHWVYPQNRKEGFGDYSAASRILEFFVRQIGPYPYKKLANVQSKTMYGGMENASNIFYFENSVNGKADHNDLIAHEIAHQWFGDSASEIDWHHVWLSEGFATYFAHLYNEFVLGPEQRARAMLADRKTIAAFHKQKVLPVVFETLPRNLLEILSPNSYQKGSWVLHMLRHQVGDTAFFRGVRQYYKEYQQSNAATGDFQRVMEQASARDLSGFFRQWLYTPGHPVLEASWLYNERSKEIEIVVNQVQNGNIFRFPLEIEVESGSGEKKLEKIEISEKTGKYSIKYDKKPVQMRLDPYVNLLLEGDFKN
ncbi:MAG TPA: M1 family metallopeptidase [Chryseosolibacter sp.]|nr:M1 family metallopeptidase [Chryseosolibacter sp.]